jgi:hypothetical protein
VAIIPALARWLVRSFHGRRLALRSYLPSGAGRSAPSSPGWIPDDAGCLVWQAQLRGKVSPRSLLILRTEWLSGRPCVSA